jgi:hypothetical protein
MERGRATNIQHNASQFWQLKCKFSRCSTIGSNATVARQDFRRDIKLPEAVVTTVFPAFRLQTGEYCRGNVTIYRIRCDILSLSPRPGWRTPVHFDNLCTGPSGLIPLAGPENEPGHDRPPCVAGFKILRLPPGPPLLLILPCKGRGTATWRWRGCHQRCGNTDCRQCHPSTMRRAWSSSPCRGGSREARADVVPQAQPAASALARLRSVNQMIAIDTS